ncbi:MAG: hypothetical protein NZ955_06130 [Candidatus Bathyarchaeota archaeon]|nr:hypothetical protein [Candidatus Bathyarchaeota archaeon]
MPDWMVCVEAWRGVSTDLPPLLLIYRSCNVRFLFDKQLPITVLWEGLG